MSSDRYIARSMTSESQETTVTRAAASQLYTGDIYWLKLVTGWGERDLSYHKGKVINASSSFQLSVTFLNASILRGPQKRPLVLYTTRKMKQSWKIRCKNPRQKQQS
jgi:hypothetical protein